MLMCGGSLFTQMIAWLAVWLAVRSLCCLPVHLIGRYCWLVVVGCYYPHRVVSLLRLVTCIMRAVGHPPSLVYPPTVRVQLKGLIAPCMALLSQTINHQIHHQPSSMIVLYGYFWSTYCGYHHSLHCLGFSHLRFRFP